MQKSMLKATNPCWKQGPHVRRCPNLGATWGVAQHWEGLQVSLLAEPTGPVFPLQATIAYKEVCGDLERGVAKQKANAVRLALTQARDALGEYRTAAKIDTDDGGVLDPSAFGVQVGIQADGHRVRGAGLPRRRRDRRRVGRVLHLALSL